MTDLRIGISMRETNAIEYQEKRDSIAKDWYVYLKKIMPKAKFILIPNINEDIEDYLKYWNINSIILTGGDSLGFSKDRDLTEKIIFDYARSNSIPILGICRGFQAIYKWCGGNILNNNSKFHNSTRHKIKLFNKLFDVNSYHSNILDESSKPNELQIIARCEYDSTIEAYSGNQILGLMWHPEREQNINLFDKRMIKSLFNYE